MTSLALVGMLILVAILSSSWRRSRSKKTLEEVDKEQRQSSLDEEEGQELQEMVAGNRSCNSERSFENCEAGKGGAQDGEKLDPLIVPRN